MGMMGSILPKATLVAVYFQLSLKALLPVYALLDFPPSPPGTPIRYSQRRDGPATLGNFRDVYLALVATTRVDTWEAARAALRELRGAVQRAAMVLEAVALPLPRLQLQALYSCVHSPLILPLRGAMGSDTLA